MAEEKLSAVKLHQDDGVGLLRDNRSRSTIVMHFRCHYMTSGELQPLHFTEIRVNINDRLTEIVFPISSTQLSVGYQYFTR